MATPPPMGTVERACWDLVTATRWEDKQPPRAESWWDAPQPLRLEGPGRPPGLEELERAPRTPRPGALQRPEARAALFVRFLHHELQAAELFAWAVLALPDAEPRLRRGLAVIATEELRHARLYAARVEELGLRLGAVGARDWFWERALGCRTALQYVALMGLGFEGGNLEHARRFDEQLTAAGDGRRIHPANGIATHSSPV